MHLRMTEVIRGETIDDGGGNATTAINEGKAGVSVLHDLIAGGVAGSASVIVGRKLLISLHNFVYCALPILYY